MIQAKSTSGPSSKRRVVAVATFAALQVSAASALELTPGDYEQFPAGINIGLLYYQHADRSNLYANGNKLSDNFDLKSDVGIFRYVRTVQLGERLVLDPQFLLPFGRLKGSGDASVLGDADGIGDLILGAPVKYLIDPETRDALSLGTFVFLPTGKYDDDRPLNLGENRWKLLLQLAYVKHFNAKWTLDVIGDVQIHGKNDDGPGNTTIKQKPRYEFQTHLRYNITQPTSIGLDYGYVTGAETEVDGVDQSNRLRTHYARVSATHWFSPTLQGVIQVGRDISVENGPKERARINLRVAKIF